MTAEACIGGKVLSWSCGAAQSVRLQSTALKRLNISHCDSLRELQLRMLERPLHELEAQRASSKVGM